MISMKKQFLAIGALFLVCTMAMCVNQTQIPDKFFESYSKIETTQKEIDTIYESYWEQQIKRIEYVTQNRVTQTVDNEYVLSMLESEILLLDELINKNAVYSNQISEFYTTIGDIKGDDAKAKASQIVISLRNSQQYLSNNLIRYKSASEAVGTILYYYVVGADLTNPDIADDIKNNDLSAKGDFQQGDEFLGQYYLSKDEANATYQELKKLK
ncbi:MAG: hypothetical protein KO464_08945 [Candidatus Methanofastidiosum sp.]|nr:hypothetical protein [Methanofastidiosum sp.]